MTYDASGIRLAAIKALLYTPDAVLEYVRTDPNWSSNAALHATLEAWLKFDSDRLCLQLADVDIAAWMINSVRTAASNAGRDPDAITFCVAAPMYVGEDWVHMRNQSRWFGGMVGNHVADIVAKYGSGSDGSGGAVPQALTDYIKGREGYDYNEHGRAGNVHTQFVPDDIVDRFCILGTADDHIAKLKQLKDLGVDQFAGYLQHDNKEETLRVYGETIIPAMREHVAAKA